MVSLAVNSVLFRRFDFATAARQIALAGYDGLEIAAIRGMCEHLPLENWRERVAEYRSLMEGEGLAWVAMEVGSPDADRLHAAFDAANALGIPTITIGPGGKSDDVQEWPLLLERMQRLSEMAEQAGIHLAVKAHIGQSMYNTPTTLAVLNTVRSPRFGVDLDPSHLFRAEEDPAQAAQAVMSRIHHVHIRDCKRGVAGPGPIWEQTSGRGDIDLFAFCQALVRGDYQGSLTLEIIGAKDEALSEVSMIAAENRGYLHAVLRRLEQEGAR